MRLQKTLLPIRNRRAHVVAIFGRVACPPEGLVDTLPSCANGVKVMLRHPLIGGIGVWLAIKVAALAAIFLLFFGPHYGPEAADEKAAQALLKSLNSETVRIELDY